MLSIVKSFEIIPKNIIYCFILESFTLTFVALTIPDSVKLIKYLASAVIVVSSNHFHQELVYLSFYYQHAQKNY